jgi:hypothetical protein
MFVDQGGVLLGRRRIAGFDGGRDAPVPDLPLQLNGLACIRSYRPWKNRDGTRSKLATGRWAEGQGRPQGVGKRWRGWYVADDGKQHTQRFRIEVEAEARTTWSKSSNSIFQQCNSESCSFRRSSRASTRNGRKNPSSGRLLAVGGRHESHYRVLYIDGAKMSHYAHRWPWCRG